MQVICEKYKKCPFQHFSCLHSKPHEKLKDLCEKPLGHPCGDCNKLSLRKQKLEKLNENL